MSHGSFTTFGLLKRLTVALSLTSTACTAGAISNAGTSVGALDQNLPAGPTASAGPVPLPAALFGETNAGVLSPYSNPNYCMEGNGTFVTSACDGGVAQIVTFDAVSGRLSVLGVMTVACVTGASDGSAGGTTAIVPCDQTGLDANQQWQRGEGGTFEWVANANLCLSGVVDGNTSLASCDFTDPKQLWMFHNPVNAVPDLGEVTIDANSEPATGPYSVTWVAPNANDQLWPSDPNADWTIYIAQGAADDCTFESAVGALLVHQRNIIRERVKALDGNRIEVTFYYAGGNYPAQTTSASSTSS